MRFLLFYVLWPVFKVAALIALTSAALLFGIPWLIGLDGAMWLMGAVASLCGLFLVSIFLLCAWDRYTADQEKRRAVCVPGAERTTL